MPKFCQGLDLLDNTSQLRSWLQKFASSDMDNFAQIQTDLICAMVTQTQHSK